MALREGDKVTITDTMPDWEDVESRDQDNNWHMALGIKCDISNNDGITFKEFGVVCSACFSPRRHVILRNQMAVVIKRSVEGPVRNMMMNDRVAG